MSTSHATQAPVRDTDRQVVFNEIGQSVRLAIKKMLPVLMVGCLLGVGHLFMSGNPGALAFALIGPSSLAALALWASSGKGLPVFALFAAQNLVLYGLPIVVGNEGLAAYTADQLFQAGWEVAAFNLALIGGWTAGMRLLRPGSSLCYALLGLDTASNRLTTLGVTLIGASTAYTLATAAGAMNMVFAALPVGSAPILHATTSAMSASGFFLTGMMVGRGRATSIQRTTFWISLALQCFVTAGGFLLSASVIVVSASVVGLFWGSGRVPWRLLLTFFLTFAFLNVGKFVMREKYWSTSDYDASTTTTLVDMPRTYLEWIGVSFALLTGAEVAPEKVGDFGGFSDEKDELEGQSLLHRVNNLSSLLYVVDVMEGRNIAPLGGSTYSLIPPLLVPRLLWPDKPRAHEGQVLLNVHFGRQDLHSTFRTYVAWGLLPEAYGNFGPLKGAVLVGLVLGLIAAWIELATLRKLVLSLEGFLAFTTFLLLANSYEMVASVFVTALFQSLVPIIGATWPFVARINPKRLSAANP